MPSKADKLLEKCLDAPTDLASQCYDFADRATEQMDWTTIVDGLRVSGIGMGMVTVVLIILAVAVRATSRIDAAIERRSQSGGDSYQATEHTPREVDADASDKMRSQNEVRAAIVAVAIALAQDDAQHQTMPSLSSHHGGRMPHMVPADAWLQQGRTRQHADHARHTNAGKWR